MRDAAANRGVSYRDSQLFIALACRLLRVSAVHLQCFPESHPKGFKKLIARAFLAIHARDLFNPADPPVAVLFHDGHVSLLHANTSKAHLTSGNRFGDSEQDTLTGQ